MRGNDKGDWVEMRSGLGENLSSISEGTSFHTTACLCGENCV